MLVDINWFTLKPVSSKWLKANPSLDKYIFSLKYWSLTRWHFLLKFAAPCGMYLKVASQEKSDCIAGFHLWMARRESVLVQGLSYNLSFTLLSWRPVGDRTASTSPVFFCFLWGEPLFPVSLHFPTPYSNMGPEQELWGYAWLVTVDGLINGRQLTKAEKSVSFLTLRQEWVGDQHWFK